jgi:outer membrane murein-binding lipoprotein Lpp
MSVIAKILVVINLVLAVVFLGASSTYLGQKESWKLQKEKVETELNREITELKTNLQNTQAQYAEQQQYTSTAQREAAERKAMLDAKEQEYTRLDVAHNTLLGQVERLSQTARDLQATIDQLNNDKTTALKDRETALTEKQAAVDAENSAIAEQRRVEAEWANSQDLAANLEKQIVSLTEELDKAKLLLAAYEKEVGPLGPIIGVPKLNAMVSGVDNSLNIIMLSIGRDDGVKIGFEFTVYRGNEYIGKVVINRVERDYCSGESKKPLEKGPIQVGDQATTRF